jgi:hypothetical protein
VTRTQWRRIIAKAARVHHARGGAQLATEGNGGWKARLKKAIIDLMSGLNWQQAPLGTVAVQLLQQDRTLKPESMDVGTWRVEVNKLIKEMGLDDPASSQELRQKQIQRGHSIAQEQLRSAGIVPRSTKGVEASLSIDRRMPVGRRDEVLAELAGKAPAHIKDPTGVSLSIIDSARSGLTDQRRREIVKEVCDNVGITRYNANVARSHANIMLGTTAPTIGTQGYTQPRAQAVSQEGASDTVENIPPLLAMTLNAPLSQEELKELRGLIEKAGLEDLSGVNAASLRRLLQDLRRLFTTDGEMPPVVAEEQAISSTT